MSYSFIYFNMSTYTSFLFNFILENLKRTSHNTFFAGECKWLIHKNSGLDLENIEPF